VKKSRTTAELLTVYSSKTFPNRVINQVTNMIGLLYSSFGGKLFIY